MTNNQQNQQTAQLIEKLRGLLLPLTTPFHQSGELDLDALHFNIETWNRSGITGYVALGSTGERVHLSESEYVRVIEAVRRATPSDLTVIAGAGQQSTRGTIEEIARAADAGAEAVLVLTPYFYKSAVTQNALIDFFTEVAAQSTVPVLLYSMPMLTGVKIEPQTVAALCDHPNIIGIKDSSADVDGLQKTVELVRNKLSATQKEFAVLTGNGTVLLKALQVGADGAILAVGCAAQEICLQIIQNHASGEHERAESLQSSLTPLARAVTTDYGIGGLKVAMDRAGLRGGFVRAPLVMPSNEIAKRIADVWDEAMSAVQAPAKV